MRAANQSILFVATGEGDTGFRVVEPASHQRLERGLEDELGIGARVGRESGEQLARRRVLPAIVETDAESCESVDAW